MLAGAFLLRHLVLRAGNESAKRPRDISASPGRGEEPDDQGNNTTSRSAKATSSLALAALDRALGEQSAYGDLVDVSRRLFALRGLLIVERRAARRTRSAASTGSTRS